MSKLSQTVEAPNTYALRGNGISVGFSSTSISGKPQFRFTDASGTLMFSGDEITVADSAAGTLVSVVIVDVPDAESTTFTLVLPDVNLAGDPRPTIKTIGITTVRSTTIAGPPAGQTSNSEATRLRGTAEHMVS